MIIVIGPGFVGSNAATKYFIDHDIYMGDRFAKSLTQDRYPIYEDVNWFYVMDIWPREPLLAQAWATSLINYTDNKYPLWGFKAKNTWLVWKFFQQYSPIWIAGIRNWQEVEDRITNEWKVDREKAKERIKNYTETLIEINKVGRLFIYNQEKLLAGNTAVLNYIVEGIKYEKVQNTITG